jgi:sugar O-acyltransferase (sialic acid O-acetyltransferase NeuD family)
VIETNSKKPIIILGAGRHAKVLIDALNLSGRNILGVTDPHMSIGADCAGCKVLGVDEDIFSYSNMEIELVNGVAEYYKKELRLKLTQKFENKGYVFTQVIHPEALIARNVRLSDDVQIMAGAIIQTNSSIGKSSIINTGAIIDHDCKVSANCHIAPGVILNGSVIIGEYTHVGTGTIILQDINVGSGCNIAAGSILYKDISDDTKLIQTREYILEDIG